MKTSKILVVEDDPRMSESICYLLDHHGYQARAEGTLAKALSSLLSFSYDLVILDLNLAGKSGFDVTEYIVSRQLDTQVIIVTGQESENSVITALKYGAVDYIKKPFEPDNLLKSVDMVLALQEKKREKKRVNNAIESSRARFRQMVDGQKDYLCCLNSDCQITFANKAFAYEFETTPRRMIGNAYKLYIKTPVHQTFLKVIEDLQSGSSLHKAEYELFNENGCVSYQRWQFQRVIDEYGKVAEIQCVGRDVTQERLIQKQTEEEKEKYRHLAEITSDWIWEVDYHCFYTYTNPVVYEFLGYNSNEVLGKKPFDFMIDRDARRLGSLFQYSLAEGKPLKSVENINFHKNGTRVVLETNAIPIVSNDESVIGYRGVNRNISARKKEEAKRLIGVLPICASCKMIRNDQGFWNRIETYIENHSEAEFSHTICPRCTKKIYPELE